MTAVLYVNTTLRTTLALEPTLNYSRTIPATVSNKPDESIIYFTYCLVKSYFVFEVEKKELNNFLVLKVRSLSIILYGVM